MADSMHDKMKGWFARIILGIVILTFALFGIETYNQTGASAPVIAEVGGSKVFLQTYETELKSQQNRLREAGQRNPQVLNGKELKTDILDRFINERLLLSQAAKLGYRGNEAAIWAYIQNAPELQENGKFSEEKFQRFLDGNRINRKQYVAEIVQGQLQQDLLVFQAQTGIVSRAAATHLAGILAEQREVSKAVLSAAALAGQVKIEPAQLQSYYDAHPELSRVAEQARVEYVVLSPEVVLAQLEVTEADARAYYTAHAAQFAEPENREVAHILIRVAEDAKPEAQQAARQKAEQLLQQAQKNPQAFGELAKQNSQDPLTAAKGGSFGLIQRGSIFKQVEDAAFAMKAGEVRGPVQTPAGFHIVMVKAITGGGQRKFEDVQDVVTEAAKREMAIRKFNEEVEQFGDLVYSKSDSLKPAADKYKVAIQTSDWFGRQGPAQGILKNERLLTAIFASDAVKNKRNTEPVEVAPNTLVAARILEYKPAGNKPLETVKDAIEAQLRKEQASALASKQGQAYLAELQQGKAPSALKFDVPAKVGRDDLAKSGLDQSAMEAIYRVSAKKLPAYTGVSLANGDFAVFKISAVSSNEQLRQQAQQFLPVSIAQSQSEQVVRSYLQSLRQDTKVKIKQDLLDKIGAEQ